MSSSKSANPIAPFHGKWKEIETLDYSNFLKAIGVPKTKRSLAKKVKLKQKFIVVNDTTFTAQSKAGPFKVGPDNTVLGETKSSTGGNLGDVTSVSTWDAANNWLHTKSTVDKPNKELENVKVGDYVETITSKNDKGQLIIKTWKDGDLSTQMTKIMKYKGDPNAKDDDDDEDEEA